MQTIKSSSTKTISFLAFFIFFVVLWNFIISQIAFQVLELGGKSNIYNVIIVIFLTPFVLVGLMLGFVCVAICIYEILRRNIFHSGYILVDRDHIKCGDSFTVTYNQTLKKNLLVDKLTVDLLYISREKKYKKITRNTQVIYSTEENNLSFLEGQNIIKSYNLQIPVDGEPTLKNNEYINVWIVKIKFIPPHSKIGFTESFEITVE